MLRTFLVAGSRPWARKAYHEKLLGHTQERGYISDKEALRGLPWTMVPDRHTMSPDFTTIFFLHWNWLVPQEIVGKYECINFHMTDVPYGRGGSPLQNLIARGHTETVLTALRMVNVFDAGPVYLKRPLSLHGSAEEVYLRAMYLACDMIKEMVESDSTVAVAQHGELVRFRRRQPEESVIPEGDLGKTFDHIRMLDAEGYPHAFIEHGGLRYTFRRASLNTDEIRADVTIRRAG